jgi:pimeloyl-ACP methyl ester carboxylesterase
MIRLLYSTPVLLWRRAVPPASRWLMGILSQQAYSGQAQPDWWLAGLEANFARMATTLTYRAELFAVPEAGVLQPSEIAVPTLILHGADDRLAPVAIARYLHDAIPGSQYAEFPNGSHMLPVTHAAELAAAVHRFTATPAGGE